VYDDIKDKLGKSIGAPSLSGSVDGGGAGATASGNEQWLVHILAAMTAGATGTIATNPLWVIKTRFMVRGLLVSLQTHLNLRSHDLLLPAQAQSIMAPNERRYKHTLDACRTIYREEGLAAFYKGLAPSLLGVTHVAVQFPLYEQLKVWAGTSCAHKRSPLSLPLPFPPLTHMSLSRRSIRNQRTALLTHDPRLLSELENGRVVRHVPA
jgi:solute carrier family 25 folate transporter 32